jgi:hypothetical protein
MSKKNDPKKQHQQGRQQAAAPKNGEIHHPKPQDKTNNPNFAAYGLVDPGAQLRGELEGMNSHKKKSGALIYLDNSQVDLTRKFWIVYFLFDPSDPNEIDPKTELFTLRILDDLDGHEMKHSDEVDLTPTPGGSLVDGLTISYPHATPDNPLPLEFTAYGQGDPSPAPPLVTGTTSNTGGGTVVRPVAAAPHWGLYCSVSNPQQPCNLTVSQGTANQTSAGLKFH